jgi:pimeloyl-ACP methyl ester carboxylesterase
VTETRSAAVLTPIRVTAADLAPAVASALAAPSEPRFRTIDAAGIRWNAAEWGSPDDPPLLLLHGIGAAARTWWRIGPALAAAGYRVIAPDLPGHGRTRAEPGHHRFVDTAADVAAFGAAAGWASATGVGPVGAGPVVAHSWGAMVAASLPVAGVRPERIVLFDPPAISLDALVAITEDPTERGYEVLDEAIETLSAAYPAWSESDLLAKAEALTQVDEAAARRILLENGDWDAGLAALAHPHAAGVPVWLVRGDPAAGGLVPDGVAAAFVARYGAERCLTIAGGPHSPHRQLPEASVVALLRALA